MTILFCLLTLVASQSLFSKVFICDLSNTLLYFCDDEIAKNSTFKMDFLKYCFQTRQTFKQAYVTLETKAYKTLETLGSQQPTPEKPCACEKDMPYPQFFCDMMQGKYAEDEGLAVGLTSIEKAALQGLYCSDLEKILVAEVIKIMFSSDILIKACKLNRDIIQFLEKISEIKDNTGKCKHTLIILSNMQKEVYEAMKSHKPLHRLFSIVPAENWVISGEINMIKPHKDIFEYVLNTFNLDPKECIFLDDQPENIKMAESLGIHSILCIKNHKQVVKQLQSLI